MKRMIVEQTGSILVDASRRFAVDVPDGWTEEEVAVLLEEMDSSLSDLDEIGWICDDEEPWVGAEVESLSTDAYCPENMLGGPSDEGLPIITMMA